MEPMWTRVVDGEYNEQMLKSKAGMITLFSDRAAERWTYRIDSGDLFDLDATTELAARREVLRIIARY